GFPRMVRDLARQLNKKVKFEIVGQATGVDREILEKLEAPLTHLLRNALDHGLEPPEERQAAGKNPEGLLTLEARHQAGQLHVIVADDGRGIDLERVRRKVVARGLSTDEMVGRLTEAELLDFLFLPGFSTREAVTEISGRGVGLDIVRNLAQEVGGFVRVENRPGTGRVVGVGTQFHLQLPITLSVLRTLLVEIAGEAYAIPLTRIDHLVVAPPEEIQTLDGRRYLTLNQRHIGLVDAREVLELSGAASRPAAWPIVIIGDRANAYGLVVDRFIGESKLVVRTLDTRLGKVQDISAVSLLDDGTPVMIVDTEDLVRSIENLLSGGRLKQFQAAGKTAAAKTRKHILVADDSITVREMERKLLENRGYAVDVAVDGMDAWNTVRMGRYDLVVSDVDMPRMNGIELVRHIKQDARLKALPVIIVSYKDREEDRLSGLEAGATHYLTKSSFHDETFLKTVADVIGDP
ncbi:MAG: response regulator, partial [Kiritimatiellota bacterium]|nr:response regulator [Kiritimatiellota bacterium]